MISSPVLLYFVSVYDRKRYGHMTNYKGTVLIIETCADINMIVLFV